MRLERRNGSILQGTMPNALRWTPLLVSFLVGCTIHFTMKSEAERSSETAVFYHITKQRHNPETLT
jgi:hypothetical protein